MPHGRRSTRFSGLTARDEPAWLIDLRRKAWQRFLELPMPSVRDEEWMRTDIRLFKLDRFELAGPSVARRGGPGYRAARAVGGGRRTGWPRGEHEQPSVLPASLDPKLGQARRAVRQPGAARARARRSAAAVFRAARRRSVQGQVFRTQRGLLVGRHAAVCAEERAPRISRCIRFRRSAMAASISARRW